MQAAAATAASSSFNLASLSSFHLLPACYLAQDKNLSCSSQLATPTSLFFLGTEYCFLQRFPMEKALLSPRLCQEQQNNAAKKKYSESVIKSSHKMTMLLTKELEASEKETQRTVQEDRMRQPGHEDRRVLDAGKLPIKRPILCSFQWDFWLSFYASFF